MPLSADPRVNPVTTADVTGTVAPSAAALARQAEDAAVSGCRPGSFVDQDSVSPHDHAPVRFMAVGRALVVPAAPLD